MAKTLGTTARLGLAGMTMLGLTACSNSSGSHSSNMAPPPASATTSAPTAPVAQVTIRDVQTALQQGGYYKGGNVDGLWGPGTQRAVTRFQRDHSLTANGKLDVPTLQAMNLTGAPPSTTGTAAPASDNNAAPGNTTAPDNTAAPNNPAPLPPGPANNPPANGGNAQPAPGR